MRRLSPVPPSARAYYTSADRLCNAAARDPARAMADPSRASILAGSMGFSPSLAGVIAAAALCAASASAGAIPGPPLVSSVDEQAGAFCPLRASAAAPREWRPLTRLRASGIPVPAPLGLARLASGEHVLVTEWIDGVPLAEALANAAERRAVLAAVGALVRTLHDAGWVHRDLHRE